MTNTRADVPRVKPCHRRIKEAEFYKKTTKTTARSLLSVPAKSQNDNLQYTYGANLRRLIGRIVWLNAWNTCLLGPTLRARTMNGIEPVPTPYGNAIVRSEAKLSKRRGAGQPLSHKATEGQSDQQLGGLQ
jgi:hypothetical protein